MTVVAFASMPGSPGATTLALGVAASWPDPDRARVVLEVDPDGGRLGAELGIGTEPGLMNVAVAARSSAATADELIANSGRVGDWSLLPAPPSAEHAHAALLQAAPNLARTVGRAHEQVWLADTGRLSTRSPALPFGVAADLVVVVAAGTLAALQPIPTRVDALVDAGCAVGLVVAGPTDWPLGEIADFCGCDVLGRLPRVRTRHEGPRAMNRSEWRHWWAAVRQITVLLADVAAGSPIGRQLPDPDPDEVPR